MKILRPTSHFTSKKRLATMLMLLLSVLQLNIFSIFQAQAANVESTHLSMRVQNATIVQVFKEIEKKTSFHFSYNDAFVNENLRVSLTIENKKLSEVLSFLEKEAHTYNSNKFVVVFMYLP